MDHPRRYDAPIDLLVQQAEDLYDAQHHLIDLLGRETIEGSQTEHGNTSAGLNLPS